MIDMLDPHNQHTRRDFLRKLGRLILLGTGTAAGTKLIRRRQVRLTGQTCENQGICATCQRYSRCGLPAALSRRQAEG